MGVTTSAANRKKENREQREMATFIVRERENNGSGHPAFSSNGRGHPLQQCEWQTCTAFMFRESEQWKCTPHSLAMGAATLSSRANGQLALSSNANGQPL